MHGWLPRHEFDGYRLVRLLGQGGMGEVHLAEDTLLDRQVAVKFVSAAQPDPETRGRFLVEARAIARLQHPNVVAIYRVGEVDGCPYLVSEYVEGKGLDEVPRPMPWREVLRIGLQVAYALSAAHRRGVLHRDIKPGNVILSEDGVAKLLDFGIAKLLDPAAERTNDWRGPSEETTPANVEASAISTTADEATCNLGPVLPSSGTIDRGAGLDLTRPGVAIGTPAYMAPELWRGEPASFAADIYSFGALLCALSAGRPPNAGIDPAELVASGGGEQARPLSSVQPELDPSFAAIIDRCLARDPGQRFASMNEVRAALMALTPAARGTIIPEGNPYRGLRSFEAEHRGIFFGRDSEIRMILDRLQAEPFLLVSGDSGVGKSSLCRAGVLPRLGEWLADGRSWSSVTLIPGRRPLAALALVLSGVLGRSETELAAALESDPSEVVRELRAHLGPRQGLVLFVDQCEELSTLAEPREAAAVAEWLAWLAEPSPSLRLLAAVRGDFLSRLATLPVIGDRVAAALYFLRPLSNERIRDAILGPAEAKGVSFDPPSLVDALVASSVHSEAGLPLLQFALAQLWEARGEARTISAATLEAIGGVAGALTRHADEVIARMLPATRDAARTILLQLVTAEGTRTRRGAAELEAGAVGAVGALDALLRGRLLVAREAREGMPVYEIAHEALIDGWATFRRWLDEESAERRMRDQVRGAAAEWVRLGRPRDALWARRRIREVASIDHGLLSPSEREFLARSRSASLRTRALQVGSISLVLLTVVSVVLGMRLQARRAMDRRVGVELSEARRQLARAKLLRGAVARARAAAHARFAQRRRSEGEASWSEALRIGGALPASFAAASRHLETALRLDGARADLRASLGDLLLERALFAEESHQRRELRELLERLELYDDDQSRRGRWSAPARVRVRVQPAARLRLFRYRIDEQERYRLDPIPLAGRSGSALTLTLLPGSYLLRADGPGLAAVSAAFRAERGGDREIVLTLLPAERVPAGFLHVPPGRFLFGSAAEEGQRRDFFHHLPLQERATDGYLIARHETTFAEYIAFLRASSEAQRAVRAPRVSGGFQGSLSLRLGARDDDIELEYQPAGRRYRVRWGDLLRYPERRRRVLQDWRKLPVVGVSAHDAEAYARWLRESGRVPGARLCDELEWERAARGADGREYPHAERLLPEDANYDESYRRAPGGIGPDEVGSHPASVSPLGAEDMAGNVWEWARSSLDRGGYVARGGSFAFGASSSRLTDREVAEPGFRDASVGLRLCADLPPSSGAAASAAAR